MPIFRPYEPWKVKPASQFTFPTLPSDPPEYDCEGEYTEGMCEECEEFKECMKGWGWDDDEC